MSEKIGIYLRLSDEDKNSEESNSIKGQREMIYHYILGNKELSEYEILEFCDDGYSGTNFHRPAVMELLTKAKRREITCIIVKDFSRFGRSYLEVGSYIEQLFPLWDIRFISMNDHFDSSNNSCKGAFISMAFRNLMYDLYSKDLSMKISSVRRAKAEQGKFITAFAPYGYQKTKEQKLIIDKEAAPIVQKIFSMAAQGIPKGEIARTLQCEKVPSPLMLRKMRKDNFPCPSNNEQYLWSSAGIAKILKDQRYVGDAVYGKVKPKSIGNRQEKAVPREAWIIVPNTHEGIVSREQFEEVNTMFKSYQDRKKATPHDLWKKGKGTASYGCATMEVSDGLGCSGENINEDRLEETVLVCLEKLAEATNDCQLEEYFKKQKKESIQKIHGCIRQQEAELKKLSFAKTRLYEAYKENKLDKSDYLRGKIKNQNFYDKTEICILLQKEKLCVLCSNFQRKGEVILRDKRCFSCEKATKEPIEAFVNTATIEKNGTIKILWNFKDLFRDWFA